MRKIIIVAACLMAAPSFAQQGAPRAPCPTNLPPEKFQECSEAAFDRARAHLDALLHDLRKTLTAKNWDRMKAGQVLWEKSRNWDCTVPGSFEEKPYEKSVRYQCEAELTHQRIYQLRLYLCPRYRHTGQCDAPAYGD